MAEASENFPGDTSSEEPVPELKEVRVFLAGKSGAGKSKLIDNLFDKENANELSAEPITTQCETKKIVKNGIKVSLTDTVGLLVGTGTGAKNKRTEEVEILLKYFQKDKKMPHLLLFCIPVDSSSKFVDSNPAIMKTLQECFGEKIWKHCKIIFTFSNTLWDQLKKKNNAFLKYKTHLNEYARLFEEELHKLGVHDVIVRTSFAEDQTTTDNIRH